MLGNDYEKRVMIVDTSNEIGGDGDIPHPGIGNARRMQVPDSDIQHKVWLVDIASTLLESEVGFDLYQRRFIYFTFRY